jgi:hypothetical protein
VPGVLIVQEAIVVDGTDRGEGCFGAVTVFKAQGFQDFMAQ